MNSWHEVPNSVPILYFAPSKRGKPCELPAQPPARSTKSSLNPVLRVVLPPSFLDLSPCSPSLFSLLPHVLPAPVLHSAIFCFMSSAIFTLRSAFFLSRRQPQPQLSHVVLVFIVHISPPSRYSARVFPHAMPRRQRQLSRIVLAHIIRPVLPLFPSRRQRQPSHILFAHIVRPVQGLYYPSFRHEDNVSSPHRPLAHHSTYILLFPAVKTTSAFLHRPRISLVL